MTGAWKDDHDEKDVEMWKKTVMRETQEKDF